MGHHDKHSHPHRKLSGEFVHLIFSPKGEIEGLLLEVDGEPAQVVVDPEEGSEPVFAQLKAGQPIVVEAAPQGPSPKGKAVHEVYRLHRLVAVDGEKTAATPDSVSGVVVHLNFAKHGEPNGVVLDSGDFVHLRPEGMAASGLSVGDLVRASGDMRRLAIGTGHVVEADVLNGHKLKHGPRQAK